MPSLTAALATQHDENRIESFRRKPSRRIGRSAFLDGVHQAPFACGGPSCVGIPRRPASPAAHRRGDERHIRNRDERRNDVYSGDDHGEGGRRDAVDDADADSGATDGDTDVERDRPKRRARDVHPSRDQRPGGQQRFRVFQRRNIDHAARDHRSRRDLVRRLLERRQQNEDLHVHAQRKHDDYGQRAVTRTPLSTREEEGC